MDWSLVIFAVILLYFGYRGYKKGLLKSLARILSVLAGYLCAILYTGEVSRIIESQYQLQGIVAFIVASLLLFFGASIAASLLFWLIEKLLAGDGNVSTASSIGGAVVGLGTGLLIAIVIVWTIAFVRDTRLAESSDTAASKTPSKVETLANKVAGKAVASAMSLGSADPGVVNLSAALAEAPADIVQRAQRLAHSDDMQSLLNDPRSRVALESGNSEAIRQLPAFQRLLKNPDLQALANATGLLDDAAGNNQAADAVLAAQLTDIWGRAQRVKGNPRVQAILADPDFQQKIRSGNPLDLLANDQLLELADIIFSAEAGATAGSGQTSTGEPTYSGQQQPKSSKKVYTWTDENGQLHVSDVPPDS